MPRPCRQRHHHPKPDKCRVCWLYVYNTAYRAKWDSTTVRMPARQVTSPCVHLGEETGRVGCGTCAGRVEVKTFACRVHGSCTLAKKVDGVNAVCQTCPDFRELSSVPPGSFLDPRTADDR